MPRGEINVSEFSKELLNRHLGESYPARYLFDYLTEIKAQSIMCEQHYVDRHYLDDFKYYYSLSFDAPKASCGRLHFFSSTKKDLDDLLDSAYQSKQHRDDAEKTLQESYLGFVVVRSLVGARIGRTVLKTYPPDGYRRYQVVRPYRVHLAGFKLTIKGLAYQEQDQGAAVCASTALWSALQRVAYVSGHRTPTPSAITQAARSPLPASYGLNDAQMATALSSLGYIADQFEPAENRALFRAKVVTCLQSQLPVILLLITKQETGSGEVTVGHAITITGFREPQEVIDVPAPAKDVTPIKMLAGSLDVVYAHDDNLGSHAHYELFDSDETDLEGHKTLKLRRGRSNKPNPDWWPIDEWTISAALVPKNEKMRLPIEQLFSNLLWLRTLLSQIVFQGLDLHYATHLASGVEYKRNLFDLNLDFNNLRQFQAKLTLPRHIGLISTHKDLLHLCDIILDVTEVNRGEPSVIGIVAPGVPTNSQAWSRLDNIAKYFDCPFIAAPPTQIT